MTSVKLTSFALLPLLLTACVATTTTTRTWGGPGDEWARYGRVETIRETVRRTQGDPAGGAVAGAIIGGLLGSALGSTTHYDRWGRPHQHASAAGAVLGAAGGAAVGAAASQGSAEQRTYDVFVRFEDGGLEPFAFEGAPPFRVGDAVVLTPRGLERE